MKRKIFSTQSGKAKCGALKLYFLLFPLLVLGNARSYGQAAGTWYPPTDVQALTGSAYGTNASTGYILAATNTVSRTGTQSIKWSPNTTNSKYWYNNNIGILPPAATYAHILYWAKADVATGATVNPVLKYNTGTAVGSGNSSGASTATPMTNNWTQLTSYFSASGTNRYYFAVPTITVPVATNSIYFDDFVMYYSSNATTDITKPGQPASPNLAGTTVTWANGTDGGTNPTGTQGTIALTTTNASATAPVLLDQGYYAASTAYNADWTVATNTTGNSYTYPGGTAKVAVVSYDKAYNYSTATVVSTNTPSISVLPVSVAFGTIAPGIASAAQTYTVTGTNLSNDITISPTANFEVSTDGTNWIVYPATTTLSQSGGAASGTISVRFSAASVASNIVLSESIVNTSTGASTVNVPVSATILATEPTSSGSISLATITATTIDVTLPATGNGSNRIIVVKAGGTTTDPVDGIAYTANAVYSSGGTTGTGSYVVYNGSGNLVTVTGLTANTSYTFEVYEFNGSATTTNYFTTSPATATTTTVDGTLATDNFRSIVTNGAWNTPSTWQSTHDGNTWITATAAPDNNATSILIQPTDTVNVTANTSAIALTINSTGALVINAGKTFTLANGSGYDMIVDGYVKNAGTFTLSTSATMTVNNGAVYEDAETGINGAANANVNLPVATWNTGSTFRLTGLVAAVSGDFTLLQNVRQTFYNFIIDIPSFIGKLILGYNGTNVLPLNVVGDFTVNATGSGNGMQFTSTGRQENVTIQGNYIQNAGTISIVSQASSAANRSLTVNKDFMLNGGTFEVLNTTSTATTTNTTTLTVKGNLAVASNATLQRSSTNGTGALIFGGNAPQVFSNAGTVSGQLNVSVTGTANVDFGTSTFNASTGTFTLASGGIIKTANATGLDGTLTMSGSKTLSSTCSFGFNGTAAQSTGTILPAFINNLTINNPAGVTLTQAVTVNGIDSLIAGKLVLGSNTMIISSTGSIEGGSSSAYIQADGGGILTRSTSANTDYTFPVGVNVYAPITITPDAADNFSVQFMQSFMGTPDRTVITAPLTSVDASSYFDVSHTDAATATLTLPYSPSSSQITNPAEIVVAHYNSTTNSWESLSGTPGATSITVTGVSSFSPFTLGATSITAQPLPVVLKDFTATAKTEGNLVTWITANEANAASFELQRSADAAIFNTITKIAAKGNAANYSYADVAPLAGTSYYRLRMNDASGRITYSKIISVVSGKHSGNIVLAATPNPVSSMLYVQLSGSDNGTITLMESTGRNIRSQKVTGSNAIINMQDLPAGLYLLHYTSGSNSDVLKVTKQ